MDKNWRNSEAMVELPEEIVKLILLRLPVRSLLRFKTVCKSWYFTISSNEFVKEHLNLARAARHNQHKNFLGLLIPDKYASYPCLLYKEEYDGIIHAREFDFPYKLFVGQNEVPVNVCNSCDGLICFVICRDHTILIWNPSLPTEYKIIQPKWISDDDTVGIGYDPTSDDYKIIKVPSDPIPESYLSVEIFSLKSNSWRSKRLPLRNSIDYSISSLIYAKNRLHWIATEYNEQGEEEDDDDNDDNYKHIDRVIYFDLAEESLDRMNLPSKSLNSVVINYKDSIAIVGETPEFWQEIWVLQDYYGMKSSWNKVFYFSLLIESSSSFALNGKILVLSEEGRFIKHDMKDGSAEHVLVQGDNITCNEECIYTRFTSPYVESLVSPRQLQ